MQFQTQLHCPARFFMLTIGTPSVSLAQGELDIFLSSILPLLLFYLVMVRDVSPAIDIYPSKYPIVVIRD